MPLRNPKDLVEAKANQCAQIKREAAYKMTSILQTQAKVIGWVKENDASWWKGFSRGFLSLA